MKILAYIAPLAFASAAMAACPPVAFVPSEDLPAQQGADCSFVGAADNDVSGFFKANAAIDVGGGIVGQKLMSSQSQCGGYTETLLVMDCRDGGIRNFFGAAKPVDGTQSSEPAIIGAAPNVYIRNLQPPHGPIALTPGISLSRLDAIAREADIGFQSNARNLPLSSSAHNQVDFFCGCKRFYPNSAGASK